MNDAPKEARFYMCEVRRTSGIIVSGMPKNTIVDLIISSLLKHV